MKSMQEIKYKNFRAIEIRPSQYRIYLTLNGEERFIGYKSGIIFDTYSDAKKDEFFLGNTIGDYSEVINKWNIN